MDWIKLHLWAIWQTQLHDSMTPTQPMSPAGGSADISPISVQLNLALPLRNSAVWMRTNSCPGLSVGHCHRQWVCPTLDLQSQSALPNTSSTSQVSDSADYSSFYKTLGGSSAPSPASCKTLKKCSNSTSTGSIWLMPWTRYVLSTWSFCVGFLFVPVPRNVLASGSCHQHPPFTHN